MANKYSKPIGITARILRGALLPALDWLIGGYGRLLLVAITVVVVGFLLYRSIWIPLNQEATLPAGISPTNPELAADVLNNINADRTARTQRARQNFSRFTNLFVPSP